jgi:transcriptional regulator with XRE-family HTH domain
VKTPEVSIEPQQRHARAALAKNIIAFRTRLGWSQEELANAGGFHRTFIAHVERQARNISVDNIERIAVTLGVSVVDLFK